jgi:hypothetical protein
VDDVSLEQCNETELIAMARAQGLGRLRRGLPPDLLVDIVAGEEVVTRSELSGTSLTRAELQKFIADHIEQARSQLPGCDGRCLTYPCSEGRHALCYSGNR